MLLASNPPNPPTNMPTKLAAAAGLIRSSTPPGGSVIPDPLIQVVALSMSARICNSYLGKASISWSVDAPIKDPMLKNAVVKKIKIRVMAAHSGKSFFKSQFNGAETIIAKKIAINIGITIALAAFKPAITIVREASTSRTCVPLLGLVVSNTNLVSFDL